MTSFRGTFRGTWTALVTPFGADGASVDLARLDDQIRFQAAGGVTGVVPCGTTGESPTLTDAEHRAVVTRTVETAHALGLSVIAGAGANATRRAVELHRFAHEAGADAGLQVTPYYNKPSQEGIYRHFCEIADSCDLPVVLYNIPGRTAVNMSIELIRRLAQHPNIRAIKEATGSVDLAGEIVATTDLEVVSGDDPLTLPIAAVGGLGVISVVSNVTPDRVAALCRAFLADDWEQARTLHHKLVGLARELLAVSTNPVPLKAAMSILGRDTGAVRLPLVELGERDRRRIADLLASSGLRPAEVVVSP